MKIAQLAFKIFSRATQAKELFAGAISLHFYRNAFDIHFGQNIQLYGVPMITCEAGSKISIGSNSRIRSTSTGNAIGVNHKTIIRTLSPEATILIGNYFAMSGGAICCSKSIIIHDRVMIGANTTIADSDLHSINRTEDCSAHTPESETIEIESDVWIGANCYILKGTRIRRGSVIGANSVVKGEIPSNCIAAGSPAKFIKFIE